MPHTYHNGKEGHNTADPLAEMVEFPEIIDLSLLCALVHLASMAHICPLPPSPGRTRFFTHSSGQTWQSAQSQPFL